MKRRRKGRTFHLGVVAAFQTSTWPVSNGKKLTLDEFVDKLQNSYAMRKFVLSFIRCRFYIKKRKGLK